MELTYELVKHLIQNCKRRQINVLVITYSGGDSSREQKFQGAKSSKNFRSRKRMFQGAKVLGIFAPGSESSIPWYFRSRERKFLGAKVPATGGTYPQKFANRFFCGQLLHKIRTFFGQKSCKEYCYFIGQIA